MDKKVKATVALQNILSEVRSMIEISRGVICEVKSNKNKISQLKQTENVEINHESREKIENYNLIKLKAGYERGKETIKRRKEILKKKKENYSKIIREIVKRAKTDRKK